MNSQPKKKKHHDLGMRIIVNGLSAILIALFIFVGECSPLRWMFAAAVAAIAATAVWEYNQLLKKKELFPAITLSITAVSVYVFAVFLKTQGPFIFCPFLRPHLPEIVLGLAFFGCFVHFAIVGIAPITNIATTFFGIVYIGVPLGLFVRIMYLFTFGGMCDPHLEGSWWIIYLIVVSKSTDIGSYFVGGQFGRHKLALKLSPNKTLEGALGGLLAATLMSLLLCFLGKEYGQVFASFSYVWALSLGVIIGILGQLGDLAESMLKRDAKVKDSNSIPGVGGILDMVDSLLFTAPAVYIFLRIIYT